MGGVIDNRQISDWEENIFCGFVSNRSCSWLWDIRLFPGAGASHFLVGLSRGTIVLYYHVLVSIEK